MFVRIANSPRALVLCWAVLLLTAAALYCLFEDASFLDGVYWSIVTATTLGYGDFSPHSPEGKVLTAVLISITIFFLIPTITANLASKLIVNRDAFTDDEQEEMKAALRLLLERTDPTAERR